MYAKALGVSQQSPTIRAFTTPLLGALSLAFNFVGTLGVRQAITPTELAIALIQLGLKGAITGEI